MLMQHSLIRPACFLAALFLFLPPAGATAMSWGVSAGPAKAVGEGSEGVRVGIAGGVELLRPVVPHVALGFGAGYAYFPLESETANFISTGSTDVLEILPCVQVVTSRPKGPNAVGRFGLGLASIHTTLRTSPAGPIPGPEVEASGRETVFGIAAGAGVVFGSGRTRFELVPTVHVAFTKEVSTKSVVLAATLRFGE